MAKNLVIVESPAKVKTIKKFLGSTYEVTASNGHVRDLPKSTLGIDVENDYEPKYITIRGKGDLLSKLRREVKKADKIYLATDPDREGEAISWHLYHSLKLEGKKVYRISFNEITKQAVKESLKNPREIDMNLVDAQQARRILDRIVGYKISPVLWAKVKRGLSAGRVQSVALRMVCDREEEISAFIPEEYWSIDVNLKLDKKKIQAKLSKESIDGSISSKEEASKIKEALERAEYIVSDVKLGERVKKAPVPFTTSTLQQEAVKVLNFSTQKTMRIAQQLYEGVDVKGEGTVGLITYLRTDSTRISDEAKSAASNYISANFGEEFLKKEAKTKENKGKIQDAHEAIRPSDIARTPQKIKDSLSRDQYRLYQLIYNRFLASQMADAKYDTVSCKISADKYNLNASSSKVSFAGFMEVYNDDNEKEDKKNAVSSLAKGDKLTLDEVIAEQHFTQSVPHYTEASLVKALEEQGIGRPSTYAPTISTIIARRYVTKENKNLFVTELGEVVNKIMKEAFSSIVDEKFTASMEEGLDEVALGNLEWKEILRQFYPDFQKSVDAAEEELEKITIEDELAEGEFCDECGRQMVIKYGPHGRFLACPGFPNCRFTKPYLEKIGVACPNCGKEIVLRKTKKGRKFYGCENIPDCEFMSWQKPSLEKCPECKGLMVEKGNKLLCVNENCGFIREKSAK